MQTQIQNLTFETKKGPEFIDITDQVEGLVKKSKISNGMVLVFAQHTTAAIKINENEPLLLGDMEKFLQKLARVNKQYDHNNFEIRTEHMTVDESPNGHSHCQHLFLSTSETIPIIDGKMHLGTWQRIFLIELDHARKREVLVQILGE